MSLELLHTITLASTLGFSYIINQSFLKSYELQITALIFVVYFLLKRTTQLTKHKYDLLDGVMFTFVVSNIILATGGISSPFFFLCYFLLFTLAMLLEPTISLFTALCIVAILFITTTNLSSLQQLITLVSLPLMTPFAMLLGSEYEKNQQLKKSAQELTRVKRELEEKMARSTPESGHFITLAVGSQLKRIDDLLEGATAVNIAQAKEKLHTTEKLIDSLGMDN